MGYWKRGKDPSSHMAQTEVKERQRQKTIWEEMFPGEVEGWVKSWEGVFYFLSNKTEKQAAKSPSEWAHSLWSVVWMDVSSFIHMAESKRRKKPILWTLKQVYVEWWVLGCFWHWWIGNFDGSLFAWRSREIFLWRSKSQRGRTNKSLCVGGLLWTKPWVVGDSPLNCATPRLLEQQSNITSKNVFSTKICPQVIQRWTLGVCPHGKHKTNAILFKWRHWAKLGGILVD